MKILSRLLIILFFLSIKTISAQIEWKTENQNNTNIYWPKDLSKGKVFQVTSFGPFKNQGSKLESWFLNAVKSQQVTHGKPLKKWIIKPEKGNAISTVNSFVNSVGKKMEVAYQGGTLSDGRLYLTQLISSSDLVLLMKYGAGLEPLIEKIKSKMLNNSSIDFNDKKDIALENSLEKTKNFIPNKEELKVVKGPKGIKNMRGIIVYGIQPGGLYGPTSDVIVTFTDGSYTSDIKRVFSKGVATSKKEKPNRWGYWSLKNGALELKGASGKTWNTYGDWIAKPGSKGLKLNGCYGNITSSSSSDYGGGTTVGNASSWCFKPNGRFAHSSTGFATASGDVRGASASSNKSRGRYLIDGYTIRFVYDSGTEFIAGFCFLNEKKSHIAINGQRYY